MIELIISLAMVAIVAASLSSVLWTAYHTTRQAEAAINPATQASFALDQLATDLKNAIQPGAVKTSGVGSGMALAGNFEATQQTAGDGQEGDDVIFYSTADAPQHVDANGDIKEIEYTVVQPTGSSELVLVRRVTRNLLAQVTPAPDEEIVCRGVRSLTLQYFDGSNWDPTWDSTEEDNTIPAAVQITLELQPPSQNSSRTSQNADLRYTRIVYLSASTASTDPNVNSGVSGL